MEGRDDAMPEWIKRLAIGWTNTAVVLVLLLFLGLVVIIPTLSPPPLPPLKQNNTRQLNGESEHL